MTRPQLARLWASRSAAPTGLLAFSFVARLGTVRSSMVLAIVWLLNIAATQPLQAQTFQLLYTFTNGADGNTPYAGLTFDAAGNLYGTAYSGGVNGRGTVFKLAPSQGSWTFSVVSSLSVQCGADPMAGVALDMDGNLYTATQAAGRRGGGVLVKIDSSGKCTQLHNFGNKSGSGQQPTATPVRDAAGDLYGDTDINGEVWEFSAAGQFHVLHHFRKLKDIGEPLGDMFIDTAGNLYGSGNRADSKHCSGCGGVYKVSPGGMETVLHRFHRSDGSTPYGGVTAMDSAGAIYGTTYSGGAIHSPNCPDQGFGAGCGVVYKITSGGQFRVLYKFQGQPKGDGCCSEGGVILDGAGNVYGVTAAGGTYGYGTVFKLDTAGNETVLYSFTGGSDGEYPIGHLVMDNSGNLYGTTGAGGSSGAGTIFEITP